MLIKNVYIIDTILFRYFTFIVLILKGDSLNYYTLMYMVTLQRKIKSIFYNTK